MTDSTPTRVLSLVEVADRLGMKKSNTAKHLARHNITPLHVKAQGNLWDEAVIDEHVKRWRGDKAARAADEKRRAAALSNVTNGTVQEHLGATEKEVLESLLLRPVLSEERHLAAARRLRKKGLLESVPGESRTFRFTKRGETVAGNLR